MKERAVIDTQLEETTSYLNISKVVKNDSGNYSCEARNRLGDLARSTVMIKVKRKCLSLTIKGNWFLMKLLLLLFFSLRNCKSEFTIWLFSSSNTKFRDSNNLLQYHS